MVKREGCQPRYCDCGKYEGLILISKLCVYMSILIKFCISIRTKGKLEWGSYSNMQNNESEINIDTSEHTSIQALSKANVLLAADVVYDIDCIPDLVSTVCKFLSQRKAADGDDEAIAIFATTYRNKSTFNLFEEELEKQNVGCAYYDQSMIDDLPNIFPCYWNQPRTDVRICTMSLKQ